MNPASVNRRLIFEMCPCPEDSVREIKNLVRLRVEIFSGELNPAEKPFGSRQLEGVDVEHAAKLHLRRTLVKECARWRDEDFPTCQLCNTTRAPPNASVARKVFSRFALWRSAGG